MTVFLANAILMALVFVPLTVLLFIHYWRDKTLKRLYLFVAFTFASLGFLVNVFGEAMLFSSGPSNTTLLFKLFDTFEMIGVFFFFVFLTNFIKSQRKYIGPSFLGLIIVVVVIFVSPLEFVRQGLAWFWARTFWAGAVIALYWLVHFGVISYQLWRYSRFLEEKEPRIRMQFMAAGGAFAIAAYLAAILFELIFSHLLVLAGPIASTFALLSGILFYFGAEMPAWLKSLIA